MDQSNSEKKSQNLCSGAYKCGCICDCKNFISYTSVICNSCNKNQHSLKDSKNENLTNE